MIKDILISEVMQEKVLSLHPKDDFAAANHIFSTYKIHHIPILVGGEVVGILSLGDLLFMDRKNTSHKDKFPTFVSMGMNRVEDIMTPSPYVMESSRSLSDVLDLMIEKRVNCIPIVENGRELVGIITTFDIITFLNGQLEEC